MIIFYTFVAIALLILCGFQWLKQNELEDRIEAIYDLFESAAMAADVDHKYLAELGPAVTNVLLKHDRRLAELG